MSKLTLRLTVISALGMAAGCGGGDGDGSGSRSMCEAFTACGGDIVGTWTVQNVCFENAREALGQEFDEAACDDAFRDVTADLQGSLSFEADGRTTSDLTFTLNAKVVLTAACLRALADGQDVDAARACPAIEQQFSEDDTIMSAACTLLAADCSCTLAFAPDMTMDSGRYRVEGNELTDEEGASPFCVEGETLTIGLQDDGGTGLEGTLVLVRQLAAL